MSPLRLPNLLGGCSSAGVEGCEGRNLAPRDQLSSASAAPAEPPSPKPKPLRRARGPSSPVPGDARGLAERQALTESETVEAASKRR